MLNKFKQAKLTEIEVLKAMKEQGRFPAPWSGARKSLKQALQNKHGPNIIAEYKRSSPSLGQISTKSIQKVLTAYKQGGACAFSILTEERYFQGDIDFLFQAADFGLPILRKDFILDPLQVEFTTTTPASALLLIVRLFSDPKRCQELYELSLNLGLEVVVEVFSEADLEIAKQIQAQIIQVNNRDLDTLTIDLNKSKRLIQFKQDNECWISASGLNKPQDLQQLHTLGYDGFLIGTYLMQQSDISSSLMQLRGTA
ncbi:MAG: indole-3-glycerol-phosphate synthase [Desulfonauticus sp.]|nr:indole-3-glycerol-phosphate synthase [Desulfonauticus sp.]